MHDHDDTQKFIAKLLENHRVFLFMKGNKSFPQCGFSAAVVEILKRHGAPFEPFNVLSDPAVREERVAFGTSGHRGSSRGRSWHRGSSRRSSRRRSSRRRSSRPRPR